MSRKLRALALFGLAVCVPPLLTALCGNSIFHDATTTAGIGFRHFNGMSGRFHMIENLGSGCALFDFDNDGDLDLYLVEGGSLDGTSPPGGVSTLTDHLYRNTLTRAGATETLRFEDVTGEAGLGFGGYGMGVASGDYDNDGRTDLYVTAWGRNRLLHNLGGGRFAEVADKAGVQDTGWSVPALFFDYDRDGWLDLFVGSYVQYDPDNERECRTVAGSRDYCNPAAYPAAPDRLFHNLGDGTFEETTGKAGLSGSLGRALGAVAADFNSDGWPDLYVANDGGPNLLWINQHDGSFVEDALLSGCAVNELGLSEASMGVAAADFDGDGDFDLFLSHLTGETNTLYRNDGAAGFSDCTQSVGLGSSSQWATGFGAGEIDYDNDGWLDLVVVNGAVRTLEDLAQKRDPYPFHQPNQLFRNLGGGRFAETSSLAGESFLASLVSRGAAFGDIDNDGDTDLVVANNNGEANLLLNQVGTRNHWIGLRVVSDRRDSLGAEVAISTNEGRRLVRRVHSDGSYASASDPRTLIGLGPGASIAKVSVTWPDGSTEAWTQLPLNRYSTLRKGRGGKP